MNIEDYKLQISDLKPTNLSKSAGELQEPLNPKSETDYSSFPANSRYAST